MQRLLILLLTLYIVFIGGTAYTTNIPLFTVLYHVVVGGALGGWLIVRLRQKAPWPQTALDAPLAIYAGLLVLTTMFATDVRVSAEQAWQMLVHVIAFYALVDLIRRGKQRWVFESMFIAAGVVVLVSLLEAASWYLGLGFAGYEFGWAGQESLLPPNTYKVSLAMNVSTILGNYAMTIIPVIVGWGLSTPKRDYKLGLFALAAGVLLVLLGTQSRGALGALLAAGGVLVVFQLMRWQQTVTLFRPVAAFSLMALGALASITVLMGFATISSSTSDMRREDMWVSALNLTQDDPLTGTGAGLFGLEYRFIRDTAFIQDKIVAAHNLPLNTLAEIGLGGVVLLVWVAVTFLSVWYRGWRNALTPQQFRYEGILAALVGFVVHSSIDMFSTASVVSTVLIIAAYVIARDNTASSVAEPAATSPIYRWVQVGGLGFVVLSVGWLLTTDLALLRMLGAWRELAQDNYSAALEGFEDAEAADPTLGVYEVQQAYVLGLLADAEPEAYLQRAIDFHETMLEDNPTHDLGYANLAALYLQRGADGDVSRALTLAQRAESIRPDLWQYDFLLGRIHEQLGGNDAARDAYRDAIVGSPDIAGSPYWQQGNIDLRQTAIAQAAKDLTESAPHDAIRVALQAGQQDRAAELFATLERQPTDYAVLARGYFYAATGDLESAQITIEAAISQLPAASDGEIDDLAEAYAALADVYWRRGATENAETNAAAALFLDRAAGAHAYYTLARLRLQDDSATADLIDNYLVLAVPPRVVLQEYAGAVYYALAQLDYLPQLGLPGPVSETFQPWLLLAERFATDDDEDTAPQDVYDAMAERAPYLQIDQMMVE